MFILSKCIIFEITKFPFELCLFSALVFCPFLNTALNHFLLKMNCFSLEVADINFQIHLFSLNDWQI